MKDDRGGIVAGTQWELPAGSSVTVSGVYSGGLFVPHNADLKPTYKQSGTAQAWARPG